MQGVGFRDFVSRRAREAGLAGWVRNTPQGTVEVVAEGTRGSLARLLEQLQRGPSLAAVERVDADWSAGQGAVGFAIH